MNDSTSSKPNAADKTETAAKAEAPKSDASLSDEQLSEVSGGFNPQPDPPAPGRDRS